MSLKVSFVGKKKVFFRALVFIERMVIMTNYMKYVVVVANETPITSQLKIFTKRKHHKTCRHDAEIEAIITILDYLIALR
jgi:hypothetical protein